MNRKKRVLLTGATGLIGRALSKSFLQKDYELFVLGRSSEDKFKERFSLPCRYFQWDQPHKTLPPKEALEVDVVIHLMGEPLSGKRWNDKRKQGFFSSRVKTTENLVKALNLGGVSLEAFVSASAIGVYEIEAEKEVREDFKLGKGFLSNLCQRWEEASRAIHSRHIQLRFGIVLSDQGGALAEMAPLFEKGLGGPLASGQQWMSWIHLDDAVRAIHFALESEKLNGPMNMVSPQPVRNRDFTKGLAQALKTFAIFPVPRLALKMVIGEMAEVVLASQKVIPQKLMDAGFEFNYKTIEQALADIYFWKTSTFDKMYYQSQWTERSMAEVFEYFSNEKNLEKLTPPFLNFKVLDKSTENIQKGTIINYRLNIHGIPARWQTLITDWQPEKEFTDHQVKGPYSKWEHRHSFEPLAGGVLMEDRVVYQLPFSKIGGGLVDFMVRRDINKIFGYRRKVIRSL